MKREDIDINSYTPMMRQYLEIKKDYLDTIVFFRLGDFYEMFFEDAEIASHELEIALTGKDAGVGERVPMCGIPFHAANLYIDRLIEKGYKIAIVEQVEDPALAKGIVKRDVVRLITPGTVVDDGCLDELENNYIGSIIVNKNNAIICYSDISTGDNYMLLTTEDKLIYEILSLNIKEVIVQSSFDKNILGDLTKLSKIVISIENNITLNEDLIKLTYDLDELEKKSFAILTNYVIRTQKRDLNHFREVIKYSNDYLKIDVHSRKNLEITETLRNNSRKGTLLWVLDKCVTAMGSREIRRWLDKPLLDVNELNKRYDTVYALINNFIAKEDLKNSLKNVYDLERIVGRISYGNANAKDLLQLKRSLQSLPLIKNALLSLDDSSSKIYANEIELLEDLSDVLEKSIVDNPPLSIKEGGIIKEGYNEELDELNNISKNGKTWILDFESKEKERTGIKGLKVGYNRVFGYYIEITKSYLPLLKDEFGYIRKQTLANAERFITEELKEKESLILGASEKIIKLEYELFLELRKIAFSYIKNLQSNAKIIAKIDCLLSLANVAIENNYVRPILNKNHYMNIVDGRHPVIEALSDKVFVKNDCVINDYNTIIITGPNMSGKSTYMRMIAIISIMAQIGSFVPAAIAELPLFDAIFTRIGASDDLVSGQSTFMVEMSEANNAIKNATKDSLILFDEIGRGTATYDGMALARAIIEYTHEKIGCATFFSTHYHELTQLEKYLKRVKNVHVEALEDKGGVKFLHKVIDGPTDKSYGINVAELAKLPKSLIKRSKEILKELETDKKEIELNLFNFDSYEEEETVQAISQEEENVLEIIKNKNINSLTPIEALNLIYELQEMLKK